MKKQKFWKKWWPWLIVLIFIFALFASRVETDRGKNLFQQEETAEREKEKKLEPEKPQSKYSFDVPFLLGKNAFEIKEFLEKEYGEPVSFWEPSEAMLGPAPGAMSWLNERSGIVFSLEYWQDGSVNNETLFLGGAKKQGHTVETVLKEGNLIQDSQSYKIEVNPLNIAEMIDIWINPAK